MINNVVLVGRLVADPETRYTQSGIAVCSFRLAVDRAFKSASGEREADFINIVAWRKAAEIIGQYMTKGSVIGVTGSIQTRSYQDKEGNNRTAFEVVVENFKFLDSKREGSGGGGGAPRSAPAGPPPNRPGPGDYDRGAPEPPPDNLMDDDLPF